MSQTKAQLLEGNSSQSLSLSSAAVAVGSAGSPSVTFTGDTNTGIYSPGADQVAISTGGTGRLFVDSSGRVGLGTSSPARRLEVSASHIRVGDGYGIEFGNDQNLIVGSSTSNNFQIYTNNAVRATIDSSGRLGIGVSSPSYPLHVASGNARFGFTNNGSNPRLFLGDLNGNAENASIHSYGLFFETGGTTPGTGTERMRIQSDGTVLIGKTVTTFNTAGFYVAANGEVNITKSGSEPFFVNRTTNDGILVALCQDGVTEGSISVSGTTVSYNGAHLSRWSQLPGGATREEILRGTVLSNIDEMCDWGEEDNEQLNRIKVSDVEGDPNVAGVFQCWDDDDDTYTNDFYCAMTGDFIIRIAEGVTVQRGDLLMSAGDGTAKPQGDGFIQDKTIAKVTSNHVACTYDDGSYCVPCVLMAC